MQVVSKGSPLESGKKGSAMLEQTDAESRDRMSDTEKVVAML